MFNIKDTIKGFFFAYLKYWILLLILILFCLFRNVKRYYTGTDSITLNEKDIIYVGSGIAINQKYVITSLSSIEKGCDFPYRGTVKYFALDKKRIYALVKDRSDVFNDMILMRLDRYGESFSSYSILQDENEVFNKNKKLLVPKTLNAIGNFVLKNARVIDNDNKGFFVTSKNRMSREDVSGSPIFNNNLVLQGVVKEKNPSYHKKLTRRDEILNKSNIESLYFVNGIDTLRDFLNRYMIEYYIISGDSDLRKKEFNIENSIVNIICIKEREFK